MENYTWLLCPHCKNKTRTKIRPDTRAENLIVFCPHCKRESVVNVSTSEIKSEYNMLDGKIQFSIAYETARSKEEIVDAVIRKTLDLLERDDLENID